MKNTITLAPELDGPMTDYDATMIAEGMMRADEATQLRAWQHLEDTGLGYQLQGWFGRRLRDLLDAGMIAPRGR